LAAAAVQAAPSAPIPSKAYRFEDLPVRKNGQNESRAILNGDTHKGFPIEMHETTLAPGMMPHPPHHHAHEEIFLVREGTVEVTVNGKSTRLGPGSAAYMASNDEHGIKNVGDGHANYFVIALGSDEA
jgi:quercetin dioxygenase-like cupin family protein